MGPKNAFRRARCDSWVAVVSDASTDVSMVDFVVDVRQRPEAEIRSAAQRNASVDLEAYSPLWTERGLSILMVSIERVAGRTSKAYMQLEVIDMEPVRQWLETQRFEQRADTWVRDRLEVSVSPGKIWAASAS